MNHIVKHLIRVAILCCFFFNVNVFAQHLNNTDTSISLKRITSTEKTFTGKIDGKYDITIYLKYFSTSGANTAIYSVKGFYHYNSVKQKIPLVGIYDYNVGLTLYYFTSKAKEDTLLNFKLSDSEANFWDELDKYESMEGYDEKFIINNKDGEWKKGAKTLKVMVDAADLNLYFTREYLHINSNDALKVIDLAKIGVTESNFELINFSKDENQVKVLLKYNYASKAYVMGMCGAGEEIGYIILYFDKEYKLIKKDELVIASCLNSIDNEEIKTNNPVEKKFLITEYQAEKTITTTVIVNEKTMTVIKSKQ